MKMQPRPSSLFLPAGFAILLAFAAAGQQQDQLALKSRQAESLLARGRYADAIPLYQELVRALPGNPGLLLNLGIAEHMAGRDREAAATLGEVLRVEPNHGPALAICGASYLRLGDPAKAVGFLERALRVMPQDNEVLPMLADAALMSGKFGTASSALRALSKVQPGEPRIWAGPPPSAIFWLNATSRRPSRRVRPRRFSTGARRHTTSWLARRSRS